MKHEVLKKQLGDATRRLDEALAVPVQQPLAVDGTIQRFEFCFEIAWKAIKAFLERDGVSAGSPRACLKEAYRLGWITDEPGWLEILEARNLTSHVYNEQMASKISEAIREHHARFNELAKRLETL